ncbi:hypothetical protein N0V82_010703 [Gnomoniopsis sp. IMI 355080]|nr:hypothetical protein N0V82_010703 [Gnomoniopsis sp. IMI 355080]
MSLAHGSHPVVLDGDAAVALAQPASAVIPITSSAASSSSPPSRRLVRRRRNAISNLRAAATGAPRSTSGGGTARPPPLVDVNANNNGGLVSRFGDFNIRSGAGARPAPLLPAPRRNRVTKQDSAAAAAAGASRPPPHVQWPGQQPPAIHIAHGDDMARAAEERALLRTKQCHTDRFLCYHASLEHWLLWNRDRRRSIWAQFPIPLHQGNWPGHPPVRASEELDALLSYQLKLRENRQIPGGVRGVFNRGVRRPLSRARGLIDRFRGRDLEGYTRRKVNGLEARLVKDFEPTGIRFKRRLGQGGFGAVFLFEMMGGKGSSWPIVVKGSTRELLDDSDGLGDEIDNLNWMNGASHFIQRIFLQDLPLPTASRRRRIRLAARKGMAAVREMARETRDIVHDMRDVASFRPLQPRRTGGIREHFPRSRDDDDGDDADDDRVQPGYTAQEIEEIQQRRAQLDNARNLIMLENMPRGDVQELIHKLVKKKLHLSNRALWAIFECLFKGCVAMATPGRFHEHGQDVNAHAMAEQDETVPDWLHDGTQLPAWTMVHFDLDPQNALVGNFEEAGGPHENVPIVKIADPGLAIIMDDNVRNNEATLWNLRCRGKTQYLQPEQFTREWEYRAALDRAHLSMESTAGNYHWWSNLYHIGWIMWSLVTQCFPPVPPRALPYTYANEDPSSLSAATGGGGVGLDDGGQFVNGHTYGMHIMAEEFDDYDFELRLQILRCLDHVATNRPKMGWFEAVLAFNVGRPDLVEAESDEQLRAHMNNVYGQPASARS